MNTLKTKNIGNSFATRLFVGLGLYLLMASLGFANNADDLIGDWGDAEAGQDTDLGEFVSVIVNIVMYVFAAVSIILAGMTSYGLFQSGDWRAFWSKIAGCAMLFAIPFVIKTFITANS